MPITKIIVADLPEVLWMKDHHRHNDTLRAYTGFTNYTSIESSVLSSLRIKPSVENKNAHLAERIWLDIIIYTLIICIGLAVFMGFVQWYRSTNRIMYRILPNTWWPGKQENEATVSADTEENRETIENNECQTTAFPVGSTVMSVTDI